MCTRHVRAHAAPRVAREAAVAAIRHLILWLCLLSTAQAAVLPEERGDVMYHRYDGGGVVVEGPSVLVRKNFKEQVSGMSIFVRLILLRIDFH